MALTDIVDLRLNASSNRHEPNRRVVEQFVSYRSVTKMKTAMRPVDCNWFKMWTNRRLPGVPSSGGKLIFLAFNGNTEAHLDGKFTSSLSGIGRRGGCHPLQVHHSSTGVFGAAQWHIFPWKKREIFSFGEPNKINSRIINFTRRDVQPGTRENGEVNGRPPADARCLLLASIHHAAKSKSFSPPSNKKNRIRPFLFFNFHFSSRKCFRCPHCVSIGGPPKKSFRIF